MTKLAEIGSLIIRHVGIPDAGLPLSGVRLRTTTAPTEPVNAVYEPIFALVAQGGKRTVLGDKVFEYGAGDYLVASVDLPIIGQVCRASSEEPYLGFAMTLQPAKIAALLLEGTAGERSGVEAAGLAVSVAPDELLDAVLRLLRLLDRPGDIPVLRPMLEREILWRLLGGEQGAIVRQIGLADSSLAQISRAIRQIRTNYAEILRIDELAQVAGMSPSSFHRHFRAVTSMSPIQFQKQIRLQAARARLIANAEDVATVGFEVGYDSPSQFSREYRRLFGSPPGKDAGRLRKGPPLQERFA
ncbi:MAG TPA: AraC family transcriptional regulator [Stellaceae bacterium]|nr:AraC family transcriptional regulator [Stellaceae bacterium]